MGFLVPQGQPLSALEMSLISLCEAEIAQDRASCSEIRQGHGLDPSRFDLPGLDLVLVLPNPSSVHALGELPGPSKIWGFLMTKTLLVCGSASAPALLMGPFFAMQEPCGKNH